MRMTFSRRRISSGMDRSGHALMCEANAGTWAGAPRRPWPLLSRRRARPGCGVGFAFQLRFGPPEGRAGLFRGGRFQDRVEHSVHVVFDLRRAPPNSRSAQASTCSSRPLARSLTVDREKRRPQSCSVIFLIQRVEYSLPSDLLDQRQHRRFLRALVSVEELRGEAAVSEQTEPKMPKSLKPHRISIASPKVKRR